MEVTAVGGTRRGPGPVSLTFRVLVVDPLHELQAIAKAD
jgi:hypothetical protein